MAGDTECCLANAGYEIASAQKFNVGGTMRTLFIALLFKIRSDLVHLCFLDDFVCVTCPVRVRTCFTNFTPQILAFPASDIGLRCHDRVDVVAVT